MPPREATAAAGDGRKPGLHPRNRFGTRYDFARLIAVYPALASFVAPTGFGDVSIDFADPRAVFALNAALLKAHYGITEWNLPPGYLTPPIPGRADYIHQLADLLGEANGKTPPRGSEVRVLDVGVGANCIYPIIGVAEYGWRFVGAEVDPVALASARDIVANNPLLRELVDIRPQAATDRIFRGVVRSGERFDVSLCNPPFHASAAEAAAATARKSRNLHGTSRRQPRLNFGGQAHELWCRGGETAFVRRMIDESREHAAAFGWFTTLVSKSSSLPAIHHALAAIGASDVRTIPMAQGQKISRIVAWRFR